MKNFMLLLAVLLATTALSAQTPEKKEMIAGKDFRNNNDIQATEYLFTGKIFNYYTDTGSSDRLLLLLDEYENGILKTNKTNKIVLFDPVAGSIKWKTGFGNATSNILYSRDVLIRSGSNGCTCLNWKNGREKWSDLLFPIHIDPKSGIGLGFTLSGKTCGFDLATGETLWKKTILDYTEDSYILELDNDDVIIPSLGIHFFNLRTGKGWDYDAVTTDDKYMTKVNAQRAGSNTAVFGSDWVRHIQSNVLPDNGNFYFASKEKIVSLDKRGKINWETPLHKNLTSRSELFARDGLIYMINSGRAFSNRGLFYAYAQNRRNTLRQLWTGFNFIAYGAPFISVFDIKNGKRIAFAAPENRNCQIVDYIAAENEIYLLLNNGIARYSITGRRITAEEHFDTEKYGTITGCATDDLYYTAGPDSISDPLQSPGTDYRHLITSKGLIINLDENLKFASLSDANELYIKRMEKDGVKFFSQGEKTTVTGTDGKRIAEIDFSGKAFLIGNLLCEAKGKTLRILNISRFTSADMREEMQPSQETLEEN